MTETAVLVALGVLLQLKFNPRSDFVVVHVPNTVRQWLVSLDTAKYPYQATGRVETIVLERLEVAHGKDPAQCFMVGYGKESNTLIVSNKIK